MTRYAVFDNSSPHNLLAALQWYLDHGVDDVLDHYPVDRTKPAAALMPVPSQLPSSAPVASSPVFTPSPAQIAPGQGQQVAETLSTAQAIIEAQRCVQKAETLVQLHQAIKDFDGLSVKNTARNMVFADGHPEADIMVIGEAPGRDEDLQGKPFVGVSGQLLDKIFAAIGLSRGAEDAAQALYISNILNWRPPGNRTPTPAEIDIARPFIEKHIDLVRPKILVLCGAVAARGLLGQTQSIAKMRKIFHDYQTPDGHQAAAMVTYHPAYLLRTPSQKRAVWQDMLMLQRQLRTPVT